jgi:hypothetical protein
MPLARRDADQLFYNGRSLVEAEPAIPGVEATRPARSRASRIVWGVSLALIGTTLGFLVALFSYAIFLLIVFMFGLGGGTDEYIRNLTITAGTVAGGIFVMSIVCVILVMIRLHRRFGR